MKPTGVYGSTPMAKTAPYQKGRVSLRSVHRKPVAIRLHLDDTARRFLYDFPTHVLEGDDGLAEAHDHAARIKPYMDPALRCPRKYESFIAECHGAGILGWTTRPLGRCSPFFVLKKSGLLRLVLDLRQVNAFFRRSAACEMGSLSAISEIEIEAGSDPLLVSQADVADCFWQCAVSPELPRWFRWMWSRLILIVHWGPVCRWCRG